MTYRGSFAPLEDAGKVHGWKKPYVHQEYPKELSFENSQGKKYRITVNNLREELAANSDAATRGDNLVPIRPLDKTEIENNELKKATAEKDAIIAAQAEELAKFKAQSIIAGSKPKAVKIDEKE